MELYQLRIKYNFKMKAQLFRSPTDLTGRNFILHPSHTKVLKQRKISLPIHLSNLR